MSHKKLQIFSQKNVKKCNNEFYITYVQNKNNKFLLQKTIKISAQWKFGS